MTFPKSPKLSASHMSASPHISQSPNSSTSNSDSEIAPQPSSPAAPNLLNTPHLHTFSLLPQKPNTKTFTGPGSYFPPRIKKLFYSKPKSIPNFPKFRRSSKSKKNFLYKKNSSGNSISSKKHINSDSPESINNSDDWEYVDYPHLDDKPQASLPPPLHNPLLKKHSNLKNTNNFHSRSPINSEHLYSTSKISRKSLRNSALLNNPDILNSFQKLQHSNDQKNAQIHLLKEILNSYNQTLSLKSINNFDSASETSFNINTRHTSALDDFGLFQEEYKNTKKHLSVMNNKKLKHNRPVSVSSLSTSHPKKRSNSLSVHISAYKNHPSNISFINKISNKPLELLTSKPTIDTLTAEPQNSNSSISGLQDKDTKLPEYYTTPAKVTDIEKKLSLSIKYGRELIQLLNTLNTFENENIPDKYSAHKTQTSSLDLEKIFHFAENADQNRKFSFSFGSKNSSQISDINSIKSEFNKVIFDNYILNEFLEKRRTNAQHYKKAYSSVISDILGSNESQDTSKNKILDNDKVHLYQNTTHSSHEFKIDIDNNDSEDIDNKQLLTRGEQSDEKLAIKSLAILKRLSYSKLNYGNDQHESENPLVTELSNLELHLNAIISKKHEESKKSSLLYKKLNKAKEQMFLLETKMKKLADIAKYMINDVQRSEASSSSDEYAVLKTRFSNFENQNLLKNGPSYSSDYEISSLSNNRTSRHTNRKSLYYSIDEIPEIKVDQYLMSFSNETKDDISVNYRTSQYNGTAVKTNDSTIPNKEISFCENQNGKSNLKTHTSPEQKKGFYMNVPERTTSYNEDEILLNLNRRLNIESHDMEKRDSGIQFKCDHAIEDLKDKNNSGLKPKEDMDKGLTVLRSLVTSTYSSFQLTGNNKSESSLGDHDKEFVNVNNSSTKPETIDRVGLESQDIKVSKIHKNDHAESDVDTKEEELLSQENIQVNPDSAIVKSISRAMVGSYMYKFPSTQSTIQGDSGIGLRYFWIHPYSKLLNWSKNPPSGRVVDRSVNEEKEFDSGKSRDKAGLKGSSDLNVSFDVGAKQPRFNGAKMERHSVAVMNTSKIKSMYIDHVRIVADHQTAHFGDLPSYSIVVMSLEKSLKIKSLDMKTHDMWYLALSYIQTRNVIVSNPVSFPLSSNPISRKKASKEIEPKKRRSMMDNIRTSLFKKELKINTKPSLYSLPPIPNINIDLREKLQGEIVVNGGNS
ncbi:hypothetical protein BB559_000315 [Furculomyces boomerangus]|uniref:Pleckstrin homology domain-containing protein n=1 Tax=Furculomyces boomerangus TaxID=61424 RepID=A0A2T9Z5P8_9FUNG|nr:hypothetical protein BB559_000315 [Furculomyces boomerangus]